MSTSHSSFTGEIPHYYDKYLGPLIFKEYAQDIARRIKPIKNSQLLEIAAGTGMASRELRNIVSNDVKITVSDLNEDMLKIAQTKFKSNENIEFKTANALDLPFKDNSFETLVCQFSLMFFPDKLAALKEAARTLKPGGQFHFNVWDSLDYNDLARIACQTINQCCIENPPEFYKIPFGFHEIDTIKKMLIDTGFNNIEISIVKRTSHAKTARDIALGYVLGNPVRLEIIEKTKQTLDSIVDSVEQAIIQHYSKENIQANMQAIVFSAQLPVE